ncbi:MAG: DUF234 domain-containing protein [Sutterellaceae bacterium]|nr:DUF234 domain-containing protein [Sutterellaceae bacterium]MDY2867564.1 DUF234 domain-containing protein [Mesosutterella sp.]
MPLKRFYDRESEQEAIHEELELVKQTGSGRIAVITGRRRVGKTELIKRTLQCSEETFIYLFATRVSGRDLAREWMSEVRRAVGGTQEIPFEKPSQVIRFVIGLGQNQLINLVIDECQDLGFAEPSFWSELQRDWDLLSRQSRVLLVMSGSSQFMMRSIFEEQDAPLYGRVGCFIHVEPFPPSVLLQVLSDCKPRRTGEDLLALYCLTGGVPWYVSVLMDQGATDLESMSKAAFRNGSVFLMDGEILTSSDLRGESGLNRTLLKAMAGGINRREVLQHLADESISGSLHRLENQIGLIERDSPVLPKSMRKVRYRLKDRYLNFWFNFVLKNSARASLNDFKGMRRDFLNGYPEFAGRALEQFFREKLAESHRFLTIGSWWDRKGTNELDLVAISDESKEAYFFEVKKNKEKYSEALLRLKVEAFLTANPAIRSYHVRIGGLSTEDTLSSLERILGKTVPF